MTETIAVIDGNSLINRAYYAIQRPMVTKDGIYTQGIFGFMNMLLRILREFEPGSMAVAWDRKAPTFRHQAYAEYKAGRKPMPPELAMELPVMKEILEAMGISNLEIDGYEADDILGTVSRRAEKEGMRPLLITGDRDAFQLVTDKTKVLYTKRGISEFELMDLEKIREKYGMTPTQFIDLKAVMGDSSDHFPGIPGVGEKTGIKLIQKFGSLEGILARSEEITRPKLRESVQTYAQQARMCRKLAEIRTDIPLEFEVSDLKIGETDRTKLIELFTKLEFNRFLKQMDLTDVPAAEEEAEAAPEIRARLERTDVDGAVRMLLKYPDGADIAIRIWGGDDHVGKPVPEAAAVLVDGVCCFFPLDEAATAKLAETLEKKAFRMTGHDLVRAYYPLFQYGLKEGRTSFDTQVAAYVLDPSASDYSVKVLSAKLFKESIPDEKAFRKEHAQMDLLSDSDQELGEYLCRELCLTMRIRRVQEKALDRDSLRALCETVEFPLIEVLAAMEVSGITTNAETLRHIAASLDGTIAEREQQIYDEAGEEFNINSPQQLGTILFEKLDLSPKKKTTRGYSTNADILEKIKAPIAKHVLEYRTLTKLRSTYAKGLEPLIGEDGRIHAHFQQTVAATGRLSCTEPNLQNIPVRTETGRQFRRAFTAPAGSVLVGADYSQIELRILAHLSGDENLIRAFNEGEDIHRTTAARVFGKAYEDVTPLDRSRAKAVNFGVIYGMSGFGLSEEIHVSRKEAEQYIRDYFEKHPAVRAFMDGCIASCKEKGYSETLYGRRRYIPEIHASNYTVRQLGERLAMNSPIQGTAADIIKIAMIRVFRALRSRGLKSRLILQIHDELIIETVEDEREEVRAILRENMESAAKLKVKLLCDMNEADTWYGLKD